MPKKKPTRKSWIDLSSPLKAEGAAGVYSATYSLEELTRRGAIKDEVFDSFKRVTKLADLSWRALWTRGAVAKAGGREIFASSPRGDHLHSRLGWQWRNMGELAGSRLRR